MKQTKAEKLWTASNVLLALLTVLFMISLAVVITLNFRGLYSFDIVYLDIPGSSGYSEAQIRENYHALIDYNNVFFTGRLVFPSMPMSETGEIHFEEVKVIFSGIQILCMLLSVVVLAGFIFKLKYRHFAFLKLSAIGAVVVPLVLGGLIALNWNAFFVTFHKIFFRNDYWIFSAETDPVITILPDSYFMHCALMILALVILFAAILLLGYLLAQRRTKNAH